MDRCEDCGKPINIKKRKDSPVRYAKHCGAYYFHPEDSATHTPRWLQAETNRLGGLKRRPKSTKRRAAIDRLETLAQQSRV